MNTEALKMANQFYDIDRVDFADRSTYHNSSFKSSLVITGILALSVVGLAPAIVLFAYQLNKLAQRYKECCEFLKDNPESSKPFSQMTVREVAATGRFEISHVIKSQSLLSNGKTVSSDAADFDHVYTDAEKKPITTEEMRAWVSRPAIDPQTYFGKHRWLFYQAQFSHAELLGQIEDAKRAIKAE